MTQLRILAADLAAAVSACASVSDRGAIPILKSIRIMAENGSAQFVATDTFQTLTVRVPASGDGAFCIDADTIAQKAKAVKKGEVTIDCDGKNAVISQGRTRWTIPVLPVADFPATVADPVDGDPINLPSTFMTAFNAAASHADQSRPFIMGVRFDGDMIVGTNGHKLAAIQVPLSLPVATIPNSAVSKLAALTGNLSVTISGHSAMFANETMTFKTQLVQEGYPDWRRVLPSLDHHAIVDRAEFLQTVSRAAALKNDASDKVRYLAMRVKFLDGEIEVMSRNSVGEEGVDYAACERNGPEKWIGFMGSLLTETLSSMDAEKVIIRYTDERTAITIEPVGSGRTNIRVVMPRQLPAGFGS